MRTLGPSAYPLAYGSALAALGGYGGTYWLSRTASRRGVYKYVPPLFLSGGVVTAVSDSTRRAKRARRNRARLGAANEEANELIYLIHLAHSMLGNAAAGEQRRYVLTAGEGASQYWLGERRRSAFGYPQNEVFRRVRGAAEVRIGLVSGCRWEQRRYVLA